MNFNVIGSRIVQVHFKSGCVVYMSVDIYEGMTFENCLKLVSDDILGYIDNGVYIKFD